MCVCVCVKIQMKFLLATILAALALNLVQSVCFCPYEGTGIYYSCGDSSCEYYRRKTCDDIESQNECEQANWELLNKRDTTVSLVERIMKNSLKQGNLTNSQVGHIRSILALAVEDDRPEGDCSNGLSTTNLMSGTWNHCFSPELLQQCKKVADGVDSYLDGIVHALEKYIHSTRYISHGRTYLQASHELGLLNGPDDHLHESLKEIVEVVRIYTGAKTANIRCASYNTTTAEEMSGDSAPPKYQKVDIALVIVLVFLALFGLFFVIVFFKEIVFFLFPPLIENP